MKNLKNLPLHYCTHGIQCTFETQHTVHNITIHDVAAIHLFHVSLGVWLIDSERAVSEWALYSMSEWLWVSDCEWVSQREVASVTHLLILSEWVTDWLWVSGSEWVTDWSLWAQSTKPHSLTHSQPASAHSLTATHSQPALWLTFGDFGPGLLFSYFLLSFGRNFMFSNRYYALSLKSDIVLYTRYHSKTVRYSMKRATGPTRNNDRISYGVQCRKR